MSVSGVASARNQRSLQSDGIVLLGRSHFFAVNTSVPVSGIGRNPPAVSRGRTGKKFFIKYPGARSRVCVEHTGREEWSTYAGCGFP